LRLDERDAHEHRFGYRLAQVAAALEDWPERREGGRLDHRKRREREHVETGHARLFVLGRRDEGGVGLAFEHRDVARALLGAYEGDLVSIDALAPHEQQVVAA